MITLGQHSDRSVSFLVSQERFVEVQQITKLLPKSTIKGFLETKPTLENFVSQGVSITVLGDKSTDYCFNSSHFQFREDETYAVRISLAHSSQ